MPLDAKEDPRNFIRQDFRLGQDRQDLAETQIIVIGGILPSSFETFERYFAARVNALTRQIGITQTEAIGRHALVVTNDDDGEEAITTGKAGQFVTVTNGALQETQIKLWEGGEDGADWKAMHAIAAFTSEPESTGRLRLAHKPLFRDAKAIMGIPPARHEPAAGRTVPGARALPTSP